MIPFFISAIKIIFLLGILITIHECGHFFVAKLCKVKVNEFAIGFGPIIWKKQGKETKYAIRLIPLGGFISMEGEEEKSDNTKSFSKASILKRIAIVSAGAIVNIIFGILIYICMCGLNNTWELILSLGDSLIQLITGNVGIDQMVGPVGIGTIVSKTGDTFEFLNLLALISISLGITNLLPIPALDGGKIVILIIEAIRKKPLKQETEVYIQMLGFSLLIALSIFITYRDIVKLF